MNNFEDMIKEMGAPVSEIHPDPDSQPVQPANAWQLAAEIDELAKELASLDYGLLYMVSSRISDYAHKANTAATKGGGINAIN